MPHKPTAYISVDDAAHVLGVAPATIRNWIDRGSLPSEEHRGVIRIANSALDQAKVLREEQLLGLKSVRSAGVTPRDIADCIRVGLVHPSPGPDRRFSLCDAEALVAAALGVVEADGDDAEPVEEEDSFPEEPARDLELAGDDCGTGELTNAAPARVCHEHRTVAQDHNELERTGQWGTLVSYIRDHGDPWRLPAAFWERPSCPRFVPPAGAFRYVCRAVYRVDGRLMTSVWGSAGFVLRGSVVEPRAEGHFAGFVEGTRSWGESPAEFSNAELLHQEAKRQWEAAWRHHRARSLATAGLSQLIFADEETSEPRDRIALVRRAHAEDWRAADFPDWYFASSEPPEVFVPNGVYRYTYALIVQAADGPFTWIARTAGWTPGAPGSPPQPVPATLIDWEWGAWPLGATPPRYADANREFDLALADWRDEVRVRWRRDEARYALARVGA